MLNVMIKYLFKVCFGILFLIVVTYEVAFQVKCSMFILYSETTLSCALVEL